MLELYLRVFYQGL